MLLINTRLIKIASLFAIFTFASISKATEIKAENIDLMVFKTPSCGCCKTWITHLEENQFLIQAKDLPHLNDVKNHFQLKANQRSCHTAVSKHGFVFEGHVPAKFIKKFIKEQPASAKGLVVPAMPVGSPGMEVGDRFMPYNILLLLNDGSTQVYARMNKYEDQF